jgi:hypothetical protein
MNPISKWIALLIALALCGYAAFAIKYQSIANQQRDLLRSNTTYIDLERLVRDISASHKYATLVVAQTTALPEETVKSSAKEFVDAARSAAKSNTVPALESYFEPILSGAEIVEDATSKTTLDVGKLREGLASAGDRMPLLVSIVGEGRRAELENLSREGESHMWELLAILAAYALFIAGVGYLVVASMRRVSIALPADGKGVPSVPPAPRSRVIGRFGEPRWGTTIAVLVIALGFVLVVNRDRLLHAFPSADAADPATGIEAAYKAYEADDVETALRIAQPLASQDDRRAQNLLGLVYYLGRDVPRDEAEAQKWFRRATELGDPDAPAHLGRLYFEGRGVPQDFVEAAKWYRVAADRNNPRAQFNLGIMYWNGKGIPQDKVQAHLWFNLAAARFSESDPSGRASAANNRDLVARDMSREEIAEAQKLAREWKPKASR